MSETARITSERNNLPALTSRTEVAAAPTAHLVPALIADAGQKAGWRYVEFFAANIRNPHTRGPMPAPANSSSPGANMAPTHDLLKIVRYAESEVKSQTCENGRLRNSVA